MYNIRLESIISQISVVNFLGDKSTIINEVIQLNINNENKNALCWCNDKNKDKLKKLTAGTIIISNNVDKELLNSNCNYIIVENPRSVFQEVLTKFFIDKIAPKISHSAIIHDSVIIGENVYVGNNVVIEDNCSIGDNTVIQHNTVIFDGTRIGRNVVIGANSTIGGIGFGYEKNKSGDFQLIPHLGNVILGNNVEIGNNTTIDRAVLGNTILFDNVKVDNLVHIAHGVQIGENSVVIANSMVAGSVIIGKNTWVAPSSSILNQKIVGENSIIGMGAVVLKDVGSNEVVAGNPSKLLKKL